MADEFDWLRDLIDKGLVKEHAIPAMPDISDNSDSRPFPIQAELSSSIWGKQEACTIPWWLAEEAYKCYVKSYYGDSQTLERIAERGGFGREELLLLLKHNPIWWRR